MASKDLEIGSDDGPTSPPPQQLDSSNALNLRENTHNKNELEIFQTLLGIRFLAKGGGHLPNEDKAIRPANPMLDIFAPSRAVDQRFRNRGLYDRALSQDVKNRVMHSMAHYIITGLYLLQILLAATFTALSAYQHSSTIALTTLGAINTVVAGLLAWLTGQGMPIRFRRARDQYREVVKAIEASERTFAEIDYIRWLPGQRPDPIQERDKLEKMFDEARLDQEANYPETQNTPLTKQTTEKNQELQSKIGKKKVLKEEHKKEIEALQKELETLRNVVKTGSKDHS